MNFQNLIDRYFIRKPRLRRWITSILQPNYDLKVEVAGAHMFINSRREHGYFRASRMIKRNTTLRDEIPILMNLFSVLKDGDTFVDVGANTGLFTYSVERLCSLYPRLKIFSIEAHPDTYKRLCHYKSENITYLNCAVSNVSGTMDFVDGAVSHVFTAYDKRSSYNIEKEVIRIETKKLDEIEFNSNSLVIKIDVEGQEMEVLQGASKLLREGNVKAVYLHGYDDLAIIDFLRDFGFSLYEGRTLRPLKKESFSLLAIKEEDTRA